MISIRPGIGRLDFPSKRLNVAEIGAMVSERLILLHKFIRKICGLVCVNSLHPSTIKVHLLLQQFLEVTDRMENITFLESKPSFLGGKYMVQVFVHSIMQMAVMDKVLTGFVDTFLETSIMDEGRIWNENDGRKVLKSMKDFIDNLGIVLYDSIVDDCLDILRKFTVEPAHTAVSKSLHSPVAIEERVKCQKDSSVSSTSTSTDIVKVKDAAPAIQSNGDGAVNTSSTIEQSTKVISSDFVFVDVDVAESAVGKSIGGTVFEENENGVPQGGPMTLKSSESDRDKATKSGLDSSTSDQEIDDIASVMALHTSEEIARGMMRKREKEHNHIRQQCDEDEMRMQIRSAIRRQVEIEIFVPCSSRLKGVLERSFSIDESALKKNIQKIAHQPQSFFGIPVHQISPSSWNDVVFLMRDIKSKTLPHDKLEALLLTAKEIPSHFLREHPSSVADNVTLGADDFLPIFIYILARAQIPDLIALSEELQALCDPDKRMSETGYYLATLEASLQHIIEANITLESQALFPDMEKSKSGGDADSDVDTDSDSDDSSDDEDSDVDEEENDCNVVIVNSPSR